MSGPCADCGGPDYQTLVVRITELEADKETADLCIEHLSLDNERMEAELAALKARRCETCKSYDVDTRFCAALTQHWHPRFYCAGWAEGITP